MSELRYVPLDRDRYPADALCAGNVVAEIEGHEIEVASLWRAAEPPSGRGPVIPIEGADALGRLFALSPALLAAAEWVLAAGAETGLKAYGIAGHNLAMAAESLRSVVAAARDEPAPPPRLVVAVRPVDDLQAPDGRRTVYVAGDGTRDGDPALTPADAVRRWAEAWATPATAQPEEAP